MKFDDHPFIAIWETTQACDLVCQHCRAAARPERDELELSTAEGKRLLGQFAEARVPLVVFTGGDPAKRPDLLELVAHGAALGLNLGLTPSATPLMTRSLLQELKDAGLGRLAISIDGTSAQVHDHFRGRPGSYKRSLEILRDAREVGLTTQVNTTLHSGTVPVIRELAQQMAELQIQLWSVFVMVPTGRAGLHLMPTALEVERTMEQLLEISDTAPFAIKTTAGPQYRRIALERKKRGDGESSIGMRGKQALWVNEGRGFLFVSHRGDVFPSGFLPMRCGNIRSKSPIDIYRSHPIFVALRNSDLFEGKCGVCQYRNVCGGARARSYAMAGTAFGSDPLCPYIPPGYQGTPSVFDARARVKHLVMMHEQAS